MEIYMKSIVLCDDANPEKVLPLCEKYHLGIEIQGFFDTNAIDETEKRLAMYKSVLPLNIEKHLHAPFWDLCLGSNNKKIVEVTRYFFDYAYKVAEELGCESITVHHGYVPNTSFPPKWIGRSIAFWEDFFKSHPGNIRMCMENQLEHDPSILISILDSCHSNRLAVNLDIGHAHCASELAVVEWIKQLNTRIKYVHLHQNYGKKDEHLGLRDGNMPLKEVLEALEKYAPDATWALECGIEVMEDSLILLSEYGYIDKNCLQKL